MGGYDAVTAGGGPVPAIVCSGAVSGFELRFEGDIRCAPRACEELGGSLPNGLVEVSNGGRYPSTAQAFHRMSPHQTYTHGWRMQMHM